MADQQQTMTPREDEQEEYVFVRRDGAESPSAAKLRASLAMSAELVVTPPTSSPPSSPMSRSAVMASDDDDNDDECGAGADESDDSVELEDMPMALPFLPALDASTQITTFEGFSEAISNAQQLLDSRLLAYSQYQQMVCACACVAS